MSREDRQRTRWRLRRYPSIFHPASGERWLSPQAESGAYRCYTGRLAALGAQPAVGCDDNGDGTVTFVSVFKGLAEKLRIPNGPTLTRDAGDVTIYQTFDTATDDFVPQVISPLHGPHPDLLSGGTLFCDVIVPALT